jgi:hypothetical protein
MNQMQDMQT